MVIKFGDITADSNPEGLDTPVAKAVFLGGEDHSSLMGFTDVSGMRGFALPDYEPAKWMELLRYSTRLRSCISRVARLSVGLGVKADKRMADAPFRKLGRNRQLAVQNQVVGLQSFVSKPNTKVEGVTDVLYRVEYDRQATGFGVLELVEDQREAGTQVVAINHIPCINVRVSLDRTRYVQILPNGRPLYFRAFTDSDPARKYINKETGEFGTNVPLEKRGTALHHFTLYCPEDDYYGQPAAAPALYAILGNYYVGMRNTNYLRNNPDSTLAFIAKGGQFSADTKEQIGLSVNANGAGVANAGRAIILEPDMSRLNPTGNMTIDVVSLKARNGDDGSHQEYRKNNNAEINEAFGFDSGEGGTARTIAAARQVVQEQVIEPITSMYEFVLNALVADRNKLPEAGFKFTRATNMDIVQLGVLLSRVKEGLTLNDIRAIASDLLNLDLPDLEVSVNDIEGNVGSMPAGVVSQAAAIIKAKAAESTAATAAEVATATVDSSPSDV